MCSFLCVASVIAVAVTNSAVASVNIDLIPLDGEDSYVVNLLPFGVKPAVSEPQTLPPRTYTMSTLSGQRYECVVPARQPVIDENTKRLNKLRQAVSSADAECLYKRYDYWTYEYCPSRHVRQLRTTAAPAAAAAEGEHQPDAAGAFSTYELGTADPAADELAVQEGGRVVLRQHFKGGTGGRSTTVETVCETHAAAGGGGGGGTGDEPAIAPTLTTDIVSVEEHQRQQHDNNHNNNNNDDGANAGGSHYIVRVATRDATACEVLVTPSSVLRPLNGTCVRHVEGWWTYEVCIGQRIRQFHDVGGGRPPEQDNVIGVYDWRAGEAVDASRPARAVVQHFTEGSPCSVAGAGLRDGAPRQAVARFECTPQVRRGLENCVMAVIAFVAYAGERGCTHPAAHWRVGRIHMRVHLHLPDVLRV